VTRIDGQTPSYSGHDQAQRVRNAEIGYWVATAATGLLYKALPSFSNPFLKQMTKEHLNNHLYHDAFIKSVELSGLTEKGLKIISETTPMTDIGKGLNACFVPATKEIRLNLEKASISGFHELGHAMNNMKGGFGSLLQKLRGPGMALAGVMGTVALLSREKPEGEKRDFKDFIMDNCGKIAFIGMLPTVAEETLASVRGIKMARKAGLGKDLIQNLKKFYGKALLSYGGYALVTGASVFLASKIMEMFTRPKKVKKD
jgi:hypothetical protein